MSLVWALFLLWFVLYMLVEMLWNCVVEAFANGHVLSGLAWVVVLVIAVIIVIKALKD